jgi:hypothetical protein
MPQALEIANTRLQWKIEQSIRTQALPDQVCDASSGSFNLPRPCNMRMEKTDDYSGSHELAQWPSAEHSPRASIVLYALDAETVMCLHRDRTLPHPPATPLRTNKRISPVLYLFKSLPAGQYLVTSLQVAQCLAGALASSQRYWRLVHEHSASAAASSKRFAAPRNRNSVSTFRPL